MTAAALIAESSQIGLILSVVPPDGLKIDFIGDPPSSELLAELKAEKQALIERLKVRPMVKLATACIVCGRICNGTRPDQYRLVEPENHAGPRIHTNCLEGVNR